MAALKKINQMKNCLVIIAALILFFPTTIVYSQRSRSVFTADLYGGIYINNEQAWQIEPSISWNFYKYLGLRFGLELTRQYNQPGRQTIINGNEAELVDNGQKFYVPKKEFSQSIFLSIGYVL